MKILLINKYHYLKGGAERAYFDTARILREAGHEVAFFSMEHPENDPTEWSGYFVGNVEYEDQAGSSSLRRAWLAARILWNREAQKRLEALLLDFRPDVAHLHNVYHQLSPSIVWTLRRHGIPMVMTLHDYKLVSPNYNLFVDGRVWEGSKPDRYWKCVADRCVKGSRAKSLVCAMEAYLHGPLLHTYEHIGAFIAPSRFLAEKFKEYGFPRPVAHVPQPLVPFPGAPKGSGVVADDAPFIFVGRLSPEKGIAMAIDAMKPYHGKSELLVVGDGPERSALEERTRREDMGSRVKFLGKRSGPELREIVRGAKALVLPSLWYENMPYVMLEALAEGVPVIGSDMGGIPERVRDGVNGFLFPAGDVAALSDRLDAFDRTDRLPFARAARESVADLRPEAYLDRILAIYAAVGRLGGA